MVNKIEWIINHWYFFGGGILFIYGIGHFVGWLRAILITKKELYNKDGSLIYMPKKEIKEEWHTRSEFCGNHREGCQKLICKKIDGIKTDVAGIEEDISELKKRNKAYQDKMQTTLIDIAGHMGKTQEFMDNIKLFIAKTKQTGG